MIIIIIIIMTRTIMVMMMTIAKVIIKVITMIILMMILILIIILIQRMWQMKTELIPVVVGALGTIKKGIVENIKRVSEIATVTEIQKISMLGTAQIPRKVLNG